VGIVLQITTSSKQLAGFSEQHVRAFVPSVYLPHLRPLILQCVEEEYVQEKGEAGSEAMAVWCVQQFLWLM